MKLITLVNIISSLVSKEKNNDEEISKILCDINVYEDDDYLFFNEMGLRSEINEDMLNKNYRVAPYIIFEKKGDKWSAFEFNKRKKLLDYCINNEFEDSIRIAFEDFDFNLVQMVSDIDCFLDSFRNTLIVKGF